MGAIATEENLPPSSAVPERIELLSPVPPSSTGTSLEDELPPLPPSSAASAVEDDQRTLPSPSIEAPLELEELPLTPNTAAFAPGEQTVDSIDQPNGIQEMVARRKNKKRRKPKRK